MEELIRKPMVWLARSRRLRAARFCRYSSFWIAVWTRRVVSGATRCGALSTFDTVCRETPANTATSAIVALEWAKLIAFLSPGFFDRSIF
jgi:hypothetical protein